MVSRASDPHPLWPMSACEQGGEELDGMLPGEPPRGHEVPSSSGCRGLRSGKVAAFVFAAAAGALAVAASAQYGLFGLRAEEPGRAAWRETISASASRVAPSAVGSAPPEAADAGNTSNASGANRSRSPSGVSSVSKTKSSHSKSTGKKSPAPPEFDDDVYVELKSDPMAGGFLKKDAKGRWSVWPRMGGKSFKGFLGYGYSRVHAHGGRVAEDIDPAEWEVVDFPVAPTGPAEGGDSFWTDGERAHRGDYGDLVGKTFRFTVGGLGGLDCGCNANFYAVRQGAGCDGSGNNGDLCEEIDFFEGNKFAWHSTIHTLADSGETDANGLCTGYGGTLPTKPNFPSFDGDEYGPDGTMINTEQDFNVAVSFPVNSEGKLKGMCVELSQEGMPSMKQPLFMHLYAYKGSFYTKPGEGGGLKVENGMHKVEQRLREGTTMLSSLWSGGMEWLDGAAEKHGENNIMDGKCTWDGECNGYSIGGIVVEDIQSGGAAGRAHQFQ